MHKSVRVADRTIGSGHPALIIAEVGQAHDGCLGLAHAFIDAVANAGADAIKFQTHIAAAESTPDEPWRVKFSPQDVTRYDYWKRMEFTVEQWIDLKKHSDERGLIFLSSPFSEEAVDLLLRVGIAAWKVASGELGNTPMLERMAEADLPVLLSTGMSPLEEIDAAVEGFLQKGVKVAVLQCTSTYPTPPEKIGLNMIPSFRSRYGCPVGLSDHSGSIYAGLAAVALGANLLEVHVTLSREMFGPDVSASITTKELCQLVEGIRLIERMVANPVDKAYVAKELTGMRDLFTKSVVARADLMGGTRLEEKHLTVKKPGTGIPAERLSDLIGKQLRRDLKADQILQESDLV